MKTAIRYLAAWLVLVITCTMFTAATHAQVAQQTTFPLDREGRPVQPQYVTTVNPDGTYISAAPGATTASNTQATPVECAATTASPTYTTATLNYVSCDVNGGLRSTLTSAGVAIVGAATNATLAVSGSSNSLRTVSFVYCFDGTSWVQTCSRSASTSTAGTTSGTINTFTTALAANASRKGCMVVNKSTNPMYVSIAASPTIGTSVILAAGTATADGGIFNCANPGGLIVTDLVSVASGTVTQSYLVINQ